MSARSDAERLPGSGPQGPAHPRLPRWQRSLLPAMLGAEHARRRGSEGVDVRRSLRDWVVDLALFLGALLLAIGGVWGDHRTTSTPLLVLDAAMAVPALAALWVRRRHPFPV